MYVCYLPKIQIKIFQNFIYLQKEFSNLFWPRLVDRAVDRAYYWPERLIARSTGVLTIGGVHVVHVPGRPVPVAVDRAVNQL